MLIIDFHTHCFPDSLAERAISLLSEKAKIPHFHNGTIAGLDKIARASGCGGYVVLPIATTPNQTGSVNLFAAKIQDRENHVYSFGSVHPLNEDYQEQLKSAKHLGLRGIKMHPEYQNFFVDDEAVFPIYEEIFRHGFPLIFHVGQDKGFAAPWHSTPEKIAKIARRYPEAVIIAAHMGGYKMWKEAAEFLPHLQNIYIDISFSVGEMPFDEFKNILSCWRSDRILFGSDMPWKSAADTIEAVNALLLPEDEKQLILSSNALRILNTP